MIVVMDDPAKEVAPIARGSVPVSLSFSIGSTCHKRVVEWEELSYLISFFSAISWWEVQDSMDFWEET